MYDRILIPTDGSDALADALEHGLDLARRHDAEIHAVYVVDRRQYLGAPEDVQSDLKGSLTHEGETAVATIEEQAFEHGLDVVSEIREGVPYKEVLAHAAENDVDAIVVGTHGKTGRDRIATLGSVTERVIKGADVPVLVVSVDEER
jgi:nucleotide-binding universal stress UspA family protein